jgi:two-component system, OmpR family, phosphate regulon sensor histidine kinase PhoR
MLRSLYWKIIVPVTLLVIVCMVGLGFYTVNSVKNIQLDHLRSTLLNEARLVTEEALPDLADPAKYNSLDALAKTTGKDINSRITIIAANGTVLGDTWEDPSTLENHASRPEVKDALISGVGESTRFSTTTGENMLYVATSVVDQGKTLGVVRVALPLTAVDNSVNSSIWTMAWAIVVAAFLVILLAALITRRITRPVARVTAAVERMAAGQIDQSIEIQSADEIGRLGSAFNKMSANIKEMLTTISAEKNKLTTILASIADGVIMTDSKGTLLLANAAAESLFSFQESQAIGKPLIEVVFNYEIEQLLQKCTTTNQKQIAFLDTTSGRFLRAIAVPLKTDQVIGALLLFQDLTEIRTMQTMRREFVGNVSHELRTPLAAIKAIVETLQDGALEDKEVAQDFLNKVDDEVNKTTQMVNELIELTRIETGKANLKLEPLNIIALIEEVVTRLRPQAERKQIHIMTAFPENIPLVQADKERIQQVVTNILHNAVKFTAPEGQIRICAEAASAEVTVRVQDTGIGISKEDLPRIFERFFKADKSRSQSGSGLGLAIAKHIIMAHNGKIWVDSQEGKGSTFGFSLPISPNHK